MTAENFPEANTTFGPPRDLDESQCNAIRAYTGRVHGGSIDGAPVIVTVWRPTAAEIEKINAGSPIYVTFCGNALPPHLLSTSFAESLNLG